MRIRPHHGMCLAFFEGKGYSGGFTAHMAQVQARLLREDPEVRLCLETDEICSRCPNNERGRCSAAEKVERYDRSVLEQCGLTDGRRIRWSAFSRLVDERILSPGRRGAICGDCQWNRLCAAHRADAQCGPAEFPLSSLHPKFP